MTTRTWTRALRRPRRALYLSSPIGLGHARRDLAIARELRRQVPGLEIDWLAQFCPMLAHQIDGVIEVERRLVHSCGGEGIEGIRDCGDAALDRDRFAFQFTWIAAAVPALMMGERNGRGHIENFCI